MDFASRHNDPPPLVPEKKSVYRPDIDVHCSDPIIRPDDCTALAIPPAVQRCATACVGAGGGGREACSRWERGRGGGVKADSPIGNCCPNIRESDPANDCRAQPHLQFRKRGIPGPGPFFDDKKNGTTTTAHMEAGP